MPDPLDDRLRQAMREAAGGVRPSKPDAETRSELLRGLARRRRRRLGTVAGTVVVVALAGSAAAITIPRLDHPTNQQLLVAAGSAPTSARSGLKGARLAVGTPGHDSAHQKAVGPPNIDPSSGAVTPPQARDSAIPTPAAAPTTNPGDVPRPAVPSAGPSQSPSPSPTTTVEPSTRPPAPSSLGWGSVTTGTARILPPITIHAGPPTTTTTTTTIGPPASGAPLLITQANEGATVQLVVGQSVKVSLSGSPGMPWSEPTSSDASVLKRTSGSANPATGDAYATFLALSAGQSTISAGQNPLCLKDRPMCALPSRFWSVSVEVTG
ncbi:MAG: hypothetical protein ACRDX8_07060 [Acidimicrobiales bacterium]